MIPAVAHFIWLGESMPWIHSLAVRSALRRGAFDRVVLHHSHDLSKRTWWPELTRIVGFESRRIDAETTLESCGEHAGKLVDLFRGLNDARARSNVLRLALLCAEGGVYLDTDTITIGSLESLRARDRAFCGCEHLVFPAVLSGRRKPHEWMLALARNLARDAMRRLPGGWRWFRHVERLYPVAVNNAILGAERGHAFVRELLDRALAVPVARRRTRYELGTTLLQRAVAEYRGDELTVYPPRVFYPLGPEISAHWFRKADPSALGQVLGRETRVVHWYASVRTKGIVKKANPDWVRAHAANQLFSALVAEVLD